MVIAIDNFCFDDSIACGHGEKYRINTQSFPFCVRFIVIENNRIIPPDAQFHRIHKQ